jgi:hypothetical protein
MGYGHLTDRQASRLRRFVKGQELCDIGAGNLKLAERMFELGATKITAIDKEFWEHGRAGFRYKSRPEIVLISAYYTSRQAVEACENIRTAFVSWPSTHAEGLVPLIHKTPRLIYLGKNSDGTACGTWEFWQHVLRRPIIAHVPDPRNVLLVYGPAGSRKREPVGEERGHGSFESLPYNKLYPPRTTQQRATNKAVTRTVIEHVVGLDQRRVIL